MDLEDPRQCPVCPCDNTGLMVNIMINNEQVPTNHINSFETGIQSRVPHDICILLIDAHLKNKLENLKYYNFRDLRNPYKWKLWEVVPFTFAIIRHTIWNMYEYNCIKNLLNLTFFVWDYFCGFDVYTLELNPTLRSDAYLNQIKSSLY